jgi:hypothetical protein
MPDSFYPPDERYLRACWDRALGVFRIVARDYRLVLAGLRRQEHHRAILLQTAFELMNLDADLNRRGVPTPTSEFTETERRMWDRICPLVTELRRWYTPGTWVTSAELESVLQIRKTLEEQFNDVLRTTQPEADCTEPTTPIPFNRGLFS